MSAMEMSQESTSSVSLSVSENLGWRIKNMANFNNSVQNNISKFRISGFENNSLMSKDHHLNDINQLCVEHGILVDMETLGKDLDKPDFKKYIDDGAHKTMWSIIINSTNVNVADFANSEQVSGLFMFDGTHVKPQQLNATHWKGYHNKLIIQAIEIRDPVETIVYHVRGIPMHTGELISYKSLYLAFLEEKFPRIKFKLQFDVMMYSYQVGSYKRDYKTICMAVVVCGNKMLDVQQEAVRVYNTMKINDDRRITIYDINGFLMEHVGKLSGFRVNIVPDFNCVKICKTIKISGLAKGTNVDHVGRVFAYNEFFEVKSKVRIVWDCGELDKINEKRGDQNNSVQLVFSNLKENYTQLPIGLSIEHFPFSDDGGCFGGLHPAAGASYYASQVDHGPGGFRHYAQAEDLAGNLSKQRHNCAMNFINKMKSYNGGDIYDEPMKPSFHRAAEKLQGSA